MNGTNARSLAAFRVALAMACLFVLWGCRLSESPGDDDHAGHVIPAHKPRTLPEAVHRLHELNDHMARDARGAGLDDKTFGIALDIANWLPEIAAASDMPEKPWNTVNASAAAIVADFETAHSSPARASGAFADAATRIARLETFVGAADPVWFNEEKPREPVVAK